MSKYPPMSLAAISARQAGKSAMLGAMYGTGRIQGTRGRLVENMVQSQNMGRMTHPFDFRSGFTYVNHDKRFGGVPVYKVTTKTISEIMRKERVPHTECYYRDADELVSMIDMNVVIIAWIRRSNHNDLQTAVATLLMLGKEPVLVRAFEP